MSSSAPTTTSRRSGRTGIEMLAVLLLGIGSVATAWCGIQASRWNGEEERESRDAGLLRTEASEEFALGTQKFSYDANMVSQYAAAVVSGNDDLQRFLSNYVVRPEFRPLLEEWEATIAGGGSPTNLFEDQEYLESLFAVSTQRTQESDAALERSNQASENADEYLLLTLLTATALFFAGVTTSFSSKPARLALLAVGGIVLAYTAARLIDLPTV